MNPKLAAEAIRWLVATDTLRRLVTITFEAITRVKHPRFWETERGFHGEFHAILREILIAERIITYLGPILEQEYQKSERHGITQRPDSILHMPAKQWGLKRNEGNVAVWAFKYQSTRAEAVEDFRRLDEMLSHLRYPLGFFINVSDNRTFEDAYRGQHADRIHCISCGLNADGTFSLHHAQPKVRRVKPKTKPLVRALKSKVRQK